MEDVPGEVLGLLPRWRLLPQAVRRPAELEARLPEQLPLEDLSWRNSRSQTCWIFSRAADQHLPSPARRPEQAGREGEGSHLL